jgi:hypothetical protein
MRVLGALFDARAMPRDVEVPQLHLVHVSAIERGVSTGNAAVDGDGVHGTQ